MEWAAARSCFVAQLEAIALQLCSAAVAGEFRNDRGPTKARDQSKGACGL